MKKIILLLLIILCLGVLILPNIGGAQNPKNLEGEKEVLSDDCRLEGNCTLDEFVRFLTYRGNLLVAGAGTFALLFFVIGGVYWILSAGSPDKVEKGKKIMLGAVIGIVIIFCSWLIIKVVEDTLGVEKGFRPEGMEASEKTTGAEKE